MVLFDSTEDFPSDAGISVLLEGEDHAFTCMVLDINHEVELVWTLAGRRIKQASNRSVDTIDGLSVSSSVVVSPNREIHGQTLQCKAFDTDGELIDSMTVTIAVKVKPKSSLMSLTGASGNRLRPGGTVNVATGIAYTFTCETKDTWPETKIEWYLGDIRRDTHRPTFTGSDDLVTTRDSWALTPTSESNGLELRCVASIEEPFDAQASLVVRVVVNSTVGLNCTFEEGWCGWKQSKQDRTDWTLQAGSTYPSSTGPDYDKTVGDYRGRYASFHPYYSSDGTNAVLISPAVVPSKEQIGNHAWCFSFWYNMYGSNMGTLNVSRVPVGGSVTGGEVLFSRSGEQTNGTTWLEAEICVTNLSSSFLIAFEAIRVNGRLSDIAIDDLTYQVAKTSIILFDWFGHNFSMGDTVYASGRDCTRFTCRVPDIRTPVSLMWTLGGLELSPDSSNNLTDSDGFTTSTSTVTIPISGSNHGELLQCMAFVAGIHPVVNIFVTVDVQVPPKESSLSLYDSGGNVTSGRASVMEGARHSLLCTVRQTRPAATIQWFLNDALQRTDDPASGEINGLVDTTSSWTFIPSRSNHGHRVKCVARTAESQLPLPFAMVTVDVTGPPDTPVIIGHPLMTANETVQLTCRASNGYPDDWELVWTNGGPTLAGTHTTAMSTSGNRYRFSSTLNFSPTREDNGNMITCSARRGPWTQDLTGLLGPIDVQYWPEFSEPSVIPSNHVEEGDDVILSCIVDANPKPADFITWEKVGSPGSLPSVYSNGTSTLLLSNISRERAGTYRCRGDNGVLPVAHSSLIHVIVRYKPHPPGAVSIHTEKLSSESLTVTWSPGSDGGEPQWFRVNHRELKTTTVFSRSTQSGRLYDVSEYTVVSLQPDTEYEIEVYAENANGASDVLTTFGKTLPPVAHSVIGTPTSWPFLTAISVLGILLLISIAIQTVGCYYRKRKKPSQKKRKTLDTGMLIFKTMETLSLFNLFKISTFSTEQQNVSQSSGAGTGGPVRVVEDAECYENVGIPLQTIRAVESDPVESTYADIPDCRAAISRDQLTFLQELTQGTFGKVLLARAVGIEQQGLVTRVAVKTVKDESDPKEKENLIRELNSMKPLSGHANIVKLLGYCINEDPIYVIMEHVVNGNLKEILTDSRSEHVYDNLRGAVCASLTPKTLLSLARGVAEGMAYLASQGCLHKDLAARNVLVSEDMVGKISDFGFASDVAEMRTYQRKSTGFSPLRWMALESVLDDVYTTESDVWSFGVLLWEIVTLGGHPYPTMSAKKVVSKVKSGYRMPRPDHCRMQLYQVMRACWSKNPAARPTFATVSEKLGGLLDKANECISLETCQKSVYKMSVTGGSDFEKF
ncbi:fibroblast growth factor receptor 2-like [Patiria miniata]|uniref:receptor protein-tyrosine kinase n=1 Tax=Patiria miniata TaxID=46514 RepID=A0A914AFK9_PATMI|nr:fibroblast growth factor receptor 2-like [Patiria miniata]